MQYQQVQYQQLSSGEVVQVITPFQGQVEWKEEHKLNYAIKGRPAYAYTDVGLKPGQQLLADAGAMLWMDGEVQMETDCYGGCGNAFCRTCSGESFCQNLFTGAGNVTVGLTLPGDMIPFEVTPGNGWVLSRKAFVSGTSNLIVTSRFAGCAAACFGGEGPFLTKVYCTQGKGVFLAGNYGSLERHEVPYGQALFVDHGLFFAAHEAAPLRIGIVGNLVACCCSGEGFVLKFFGPCVVYTKSRDPAKWAREKQQHARGRGGGGAGVGGVVNVQVQLPGPGSAAVRV